MPFLLANFHPAAAGGSLGSAAPKMHTYKTQDAITVVRVANYFLAVNSLLEIGDLIYVVVVNGSGVLQTASNLVVKDKTATAVDTTDQTAITVTDTD
jgi:aryl-phospho-beta-D-glucosidase BglC (GH1 family)